MPCRAPAASTALATPAVRSTMWPCPLVRNRSIALWTAIARARSAAPQSPEAPLADLEHRAVEPLGREVLLVGAERLAVEAHAALLEQAPALRPRQPEDRLHQRGQVDAAVDRLEGGVLDLLRRPMLDVEAVEALLGRARRRLVVEAGHERPRQRALGVPRADAVRRGLAQQEPVVDVERGVGHAHRLAVDLLRGLGDADVVAQRLGHA